MFNKSFLTVAAIFAITGPSLVSASPIAYSDALDTRAPFVTTRHCEGQKIVDHKKDEATGKVTKSTVQTCASGSECYTYGNGRVGCAKKQKRSEIDELDSELTGKHVDRHHSCLWIARAPFVTTRHCEGQKIVDHKKDEATGKVTKSTVQTCASGSECYTYGNGRVGCAKKQ
ncbi:hypothetical protein Hypma_008470 [Hypsizygus marmoreus]|uniref:Uncharacterized protein n=1 Tax=Hypsizygus marmoreus TaxID=39966 RepID=A0A369JQA1_HYPMA|nr:hypothetical protein Hypma_008470 [Hypsizygus marmoreus]